MLKTRMKRMRPSGPEVLKIGQIYRNVARQCFEPSDVSDLEAILTRGDLAEIEKHVKVKDMFSAMARELRRALLANKIRLPGDFAQVITYSEEPANDLEEVTIEISMRKFSESEKAAILLKVLKVIHDEWVRIHSDRFFTNDKKDKCKFLQFELLGPDEIRTHCIFTEEVFTMFGLQPDEAEITKQYWKLQEAFLKENQLFSREKLVDFIMKADYNPLARDICDILRTDRKVAEIMADN